VPINCGGLPDTLVENELFGHEAGAFTGAQKARAGKIESAHGGTLFFDEVESMPAAVQVKLLRVLQERVVERLGSNRLVPVDCRVLAASKADLKTMSDEGRFRADLYYRLGVAFVEVPLEVPPLRERRQDIGMLFDHFALLAASRYGREVPELQPAQRAELMTHDWPGNLRELGNVATRFVLGLGGARLTPGAGVAAPGPAQSLHEQMEQFERALIAETLRQHRGDVTASAKAMGLPKQTLYDKLKRLQMQACRCKAPTSATPDPRPRRRTRYGKPESRRRGRPGFRAPAGHASRACAASPCQQRKMQALVNKGNLLRPPAGACWHEGCNPPG